MLKKLDAETCHNCPHELVTGVACDWRPMDECPYLEPTEKAKNASRLRLVPAPVSGETDAIRGFN